MQHFFNFIWQKDIAPSKYENLLFILALLLQKKQLVEN